MRYFISDTHFFHEDLLGDDDFAPRPFASAAEMNQIIISHWNARVTDRDTVYHLGDIAMNPSNAKGHQEILDLLCQLNGHLVFVKGNHDNRSLFNYLKRNDPGIPDQECPKFEFHDVGTLIKFNHHQYYMTHYPLWLGTTLNSRNLHGHVHNYSMPIAENINVGIDSPERGLLEKQLLFGTPLSEREIDEIADRKRELLAKSTE